MRVGHVYRLLPVSKAVNRSRDRVILIEQDKESASFSARVLVLVHSM